MELADFDFPLPEDLIAQTPTPTREGSRLMVVDRAAGGISTGIFTDILSHLLPGDLLVLNDTKVIPARLMGRKETGGRVECLLVRRLSADGNRWEAMLGCSKPPRVGSILLFPLDTPAIVDGREEGDLWQLTFRPPRPFDEWLSTAGEIPLPPYIRRKPDAVDESRYQTVFARTPGAVAAPTAGLHFTEELLSRLSDRGVDSCRVTLHVGPGTFQPVRTERVEDHRMHAEEYHIPRDAAERIAQCRRSGGRIVAVGTTVVRTLESAAGDDGIIREGSGSTTLFIMPGYRFRAVDLLLTNFHLPRSTLLMLVAAFAGRELVLDAYRRAVEERFRFFSYGDAMLIR
ncbi:MAG: tRNA preQ1(34) S-adenosylmethionine ribosyltransferase-isomerase QueA [Desulfuromonadia bacterium]